MVHGKGIMDIPNSSNKQSYKIWAHMFDRCYNKNSIRYSLSYSDCKICDKWLYYSNFEKWFNENYVYGYELDKDILSGGNGQLYSPQTCCFVPHSLNAFIVSIKHNKRKDFPIGIYSDNKRFGVKISMYGKNTHLGYYRTKEEAFAVYKEAKKYIKEIAEDYYQKGLITERVYKALLNYKVK